MDDTRNWYQKKRFIIPAIFVGLIFIGSLGNDGPSTADTKGNSFDSQTPESTLKSDLDTEKSFDSISDDEDDDEQVPLSNNKYYRNSDGEKVHSPAHAPAVPAGASAKCADGTYSFSRSRRGTCSHHGGVVRWY